MTLIGYFEHETFSSDQSLTFAEIQEISAVRSNWGSGDYFEIQARASAGAMTRIYIIRPADKNNNRGFRLFETQSEANALLETMLSSIDKDAIDLRRIGDFYGTIESHMPLVRITNEWDECTGSEKPIVIRIANNEEMTGE